MGKHPHNDSAPMLSPFFRSNSSTAQPSGRRNDDAQSTQAAHGVMDSADGAASADDASTQSTTMSALDSMATQERRYRLDPLYIENPLALQTNVTRNCFRIYRIQRLFSDSVSKSD